MAPIMSYHSAAAKSLGSLVFLVAIVAFLGRINDLRAAPRRTSEDVQTKHLRERSSSDPSPEGIISIPPSQMKVHYYQLWNHTSSTIDVPLEYQYPFGSSTTDDETDETGRRPRLRTSLEILQHVLHHHDYQSEFEAVKSYIEGDTSVAPQCLLPDVNATRQLAHTVARFRAQEQQEQQERQEQPQDPWEKLRLPLPILNVGYPKAGSTTLNGYFSCIGLKSSHEQIGDAMVRRLEDGENLWGTDDGKPLYHAYTELDNNFDPGHYPQVSLLDEIHETVPAATLVMNFRPIRDWIESLNHWKHLREQFNAFDVPGLMLTTEQRRRLEDWRKLPEENAGRTKGSSLVPLTDVQLAQWWCGHVLHLREYVKEYPGHALLELDLYDREGTQNVLYDLFQADTESNDDPEKPTRQCWGHANANNYTTN